MHRRGGVAPLRLPASRTRGGGCSEADSHHGTPWPWLTACPEPAVRPSGVQTSLPLADQVDEASAASGQLYWELPPPAPGLGHRRAVHKVVIS
jgi:hypothetical protein